ncbi:MAG TPA: enoyl-[acyl-carrier-protein] reductase FabK [Spirochaetia bacterium]|nr:enoyl-[acyl-carrier-protein] reductase FabK [Spirochaetia bacterium]
MSLHTPLCDLLGIEYPILQGGMAWVSEATLAAAVSNAGALGIIGSGSADPDWVAREIRKVRELTDRPFGVNVMLRNPHVDGIMAVIREFCVPVVTTGAGNPGKYVAGLKEAGIRIFPVVSAVALVKRLVRNGVDGLIAEGMESGGHIGELGTFPLVPQVVDAAKVPVIAAGGIFDGRGLAAALALGASGVQLGTRFMAAAECTIHPRVKEALIRASDRDTAVTGRALGHPVRGLCNKLTRQWEKLEAAGASPEELEKLGLGRLRAAMMEGDVVYGTVCAGQVAGMVKEIQPAREIIGEIMAGAREVIRRLGRMV